MSITYQYLTDRTLVVQSAITTDTLIHVVIPSDVSQNPAGSSYKAKLSQILPGISGLTFTGNSLSTCISDIYVSNLHSCSPLLINPNDEGNVYFGSTSGVTIDLINKRVGINTNNPQYKIDVIGTQSRLYYDSESVGGRILLSGNTNVPRIGVGIPTYLTKPAAGFDVGMRAWNDATYPGYGKVGDAFFYAGNETNGFNFLNPPGTGTEDYIRFYAGQTANGTTPDVHIQGSGTTRGYVGINTGNPQYLFDIVNANSRLYYDPTSVGGRLTVSGTTNLPRFGVEIPPYLTKPQATVSVGMRAWDDTLYPDYGNLGDAHLYAGVNAYGLNIISEYGANSADYIRFYAGQDANGTTPDVHIQGSGTTRGHVGVGTGLPTQKLHVSGNTLINGGLTANTISATTYLNLPTNLFVTTGITATTQTLSTGYTYYGIVHSSNVDLTLPNSTGIDGFNFIIKDESGNSGIYRIRLTPLSGLIDGNSYVDMNINYMSLTLMVRNGNWYII
jgi:hypothetical protein